MNESDIMHVNMRENSFIEFILVLFPDSDGVSYQSSKCLSKDRAYPSSRYL